MSSQDQNTPVYFKSLTIKGVNNFISEQTLDFTNPDGSSALFTVILGNNNTGKTTLLRCLAGMDLEEYSTYVNSRDNTVISHDSFSIKLGLIPSDYRDNIKQRIKSLISISLDNQMGWSYHRNSAATFHQGFSSHFVKPLRASNYIFFHSFKIDGYGTQRKQGKSSYTEYELKDRTETLFKDETDSIINAEEWFLATEFDRLKGNEQAEKNLEQIKDALINLLPDVKDIQIAEEGKRRVHFINNNEDRVLINQLGSGYQSLVTWVVDYAKRLFDRYPDSSNPLAEPGIVLVDELDLHLHPDWQRKIVSFLREKFPQTQFIATAHSPLVVQSAENINVVVLNYDEAQKEVIINQPSITNYQGWTVEEILSELMQMGDKVMSDEYLRLMTQFDEGLDAEDYAQAKAAYDQLEDMVHSSGQLKLLRLQLAAITPAHND